MNIPAQLSYPLPPIRKKQVQNAYIHRLLGTRDRILCLVRRGWPPAAGNEKGWEGL